MKYFGERFSVVRRYLFDSPNGLIGGRMQPKDRSGSRYLKRQPSLFEVRIQTIAKLGGP
jgi:hypothetical protein